MRHFQKTLERIRFGWGNADAFFALQEKKAMHKRERSEWTEQRVRNDQAYFILMFAAFEDLVRRKFQQVRNRHAAAEKPWKTRRVWQELSPEAPFLTKLAVLTEKGQSNFNAIRSLYRNQRNRIAHGDFAAVGPIVIPIVHSELVRISRQLSN